LEVKTQRTFLVLHGGESDIRPATGRDSLADAVARSVHPRSILKSKESSKRMPTALGQTLTPYTGKAMKA
jgi:hypothetical protein